MGQTLTHGVYLPDEGERNCYNGLASNWSILDGAVGTVAEHTSQIAGKAPAVHTHTKSDITDFPVYGTTAGTICEGNDSRLSDARTPVAHTHLTTDVTDLLNSAHTWTGANTFQGGGIRIKDTAAVSAGGYGAAIYFYDYQGNRYGYIQPYVTSDNYKNIIIGADGTGRVQLNSDLVPYYANAVNLGNSTYKWKTLNGINPGALSLPNLDSDGYTDLSGNISDNAEYLYTPAYDGWLALYCQTTGFHAENAVGIFNKEDAASYRWANSVTSSINLLRYGKYHGSIILPVRAGIQYGCWVVVNSSTPLATSTLFFYKAKGNV